MQTLLCQLSHKVFKSIKVEFGILLRLVGVMNPKHNLPCPFNIKGREPYFCDF